VQQHSLILGANGKQGASFLGGAALDVAQNDHGPLTRRQALHSFPDVIPEFTSGNDPLGA
jgi:hypothetical protein